MVWFVCNMRLQHMNTFASENLTVKGITVIESCFEPKLLW